jgi:alpha-mannosidase
MIRIHRRAVIPCLAMAISALSLNAAPAASPQLPAAVAMPARWLQGFVKPVSGDTIVYPWAYPGQTKSLLSRATTGRMTAAWTGEAAPPGAAGDLVTYLWHAGTASGSGAHAFTFAVNGTPVAAFRSGKSVDDREWTVTGERGAVLSFRTTRIGTFNELFGFMWVTAPRSLFGAGAPQFSVTGEAAGSQDYYLGPQERVETFVRARPEEAVLASGERAVRVEISSTRDPESVRLEAGGAPIVSETQPGYTSLLVPAGANTDRSMSVTITVGTDAPVTQALALKTVTSRTLHLLPHSHVDIGYSDPQPEVERKQWRNLRDAVDLARRTASYPPGARFKWNVEGLWSVESYLKQAPPEERDAFLAAVRGGTISLQANDTNVLTGLATPEELRRWTSGSRRLRAAYGLQPGTTAMHSDIPGLGWTSVAALTEAGVRYVSSGPNYVPGLPDGGDRIGGTLKALGDKPFWWASPSGEERLLFWMAGRGYSWFHGLNMGRMTDRNRDDVLQYVKALADTGYPFDMVQVRYTIGGDNGPVDQELPDAVKAWNEQFSSPRLVINTADAMFAEFEQKHGAALPVWAGDMTPYWEDGAISSAAEETLARAAARRLAQAGTLWVLRQPGAFPAADADEAWRNLIMWHEHTWGAADSISQPDRPDVVAQWVYKRAFALEASKRSLALLEGAAPAPGSAIDVVNTLSWPRSGLVFLTAAQSTTGDRVRTRDDRTVPSQRLKDGRLAVWLENVPALASVRLLVGAGEAVSPKTPLRVTTGALDNGRLQLQIDPHGGTIARLLWKGEADRRPVFGPASPRSPIGPPGRPSSTAIDLTWRSGASGREVPLNAGPLFQYLYVAGRDPSRATPSSGGNIAASDIGPLVSVIELRGQAPATSGIRRTLVVAAGSDTLEMTVEIDKIAVRDKESGHLAFPLNIPGGVVRVDLGEALVEPERNQLPGSCRDFIGAHSVVDISNADTGVSIATLDAPLLELGAITDERQNDRGTRTWRERTAAGTTVYAYLFNNYWHTNYKAYQQGPLTYRFVLRPHAGFDALALRRFSDEQDNPLLVFPVDPAAPDVQAPFALSGDPVTLSSLRAANDGAALVARLFNPSSKPASVTIRPAAPGSSVEEVVSVATGQATHRMTDGRVTVPALGTRTVRVGRR